VRPRASAATTSPIDPTRWPSGVNLRPGYSASSSATARYIAATGGGSLTLLFMREPFLMRVQVRAYRVLSPRLRISSIVRMAKTTLRFWTDADEVGDTVRPVTCAS
jgi:hypothetical protein